MWISQDLFAVGYWSVFAAELAPVSWQVFVAVVAAVVVVEPDAVAEVVFVDAVEAPGPGELWRGL